MFFKNKANIKHWLKLITTTSATQILVQALGLVSGIIVIRLLPVEEYAWYVLANTMLGTMSVLADGGISQGMMAEGGKVWQDNKKLSIIYATGLDLRKKFAIFSLIVTTPILIYLLLDNNASWLTSFLITLALIPSFYATITDTILQIVPKLHQSIKPLQKNVAEVSVLRLISLFGIIFIFPFAYVIVLANGLPRIYGNIKLKKIAEKHISLNAKPDPEVRKNILKVVKRILPGSIYYAISGQLVIWLISIFGETKNIAEIGALQRLTMIITLILFIIDYIFVPRFAKLNNKQNILNKEFLYTLMALLVLSIFIIGVVYYFDDLILYLLGDGYKYLTLALFLMSISACLKLFNFAINKILSARGIIVPPYVLIPFIVFTQVIMIFILDLSTIIGIIYYSIYTIIPIILIRVIYFFLYTSKL